METEIAPTVYSVALCDYPSLPDSARIAAETRYVKVLERQLGGAQGVADVLLTVLRLEEASDGADATPAQLEAMARWARAAAAARVAGYQGLEEVEGSYFTAELD